MHEDRNKKKFQNNIVYKINVIIVIIVRRCTLYGSNEEEVAHEIERIHKKLRRGFYSDWRAYKRKKSPNFLLGHRKNH